MLNWLRRKLGGWFVVSDTTRTLAAVLRMPPEIQAMIASEIQDVMAEADDALSSLLPAPNSQVDEVIRQLIMAATERRHLSLRRGARDWSDPEWAAAALIEAWVLGMSGQLGKNAFLDIDVGLRTFVGRALRS